MKKTKEIKNWKDFYDLPLRSDGISYIWSKSNNMALMMTTDLTPTTMERITRRINGEIIPYKEDRVSFGRDGIDIYMKVGRKITQLFCIRGWGGLTGTGGGAALNEDFAVKLQNEFADFILERLRASI